MLVLKTQKGPIKSDRSKRSGRWSIEANDLHKTVDRNQWRAADPPESNRTIRIRVSPDQVQSNQSTEKMGTAE